MGDNESSTTQAPQQHEPEPENDHSSEATIPGAVDFVKRILETRSNEDAHHGPVPSSVNAPFPGVDPSSPQPVTDSSILILEIHEGQTVFIIIILVFVQYFLLSNIHICSNS